MCLAAARFHSARAACCALGGPRARGSCARLRLGLPRSLWAQYFYDKSWRNLHLHPARLARRAARTVCAYCTRSWLQLYSPAAAAAASEAQKRTATLIAIQRDALAQTRPISRPQARSSNQRRLAPFAPQAARPARGSQRDRKWRRVGESSARGGTATVVIETGARTRAARLFVRTGGH